MIEIIAGAVSEGLPLSTACKAAGISEKTLQAWLSQAKSEDNTCEKIAELKQAIDQARFDFQQKCVNKIQQFSDEKSDSSGYKYLLERSPQSRRDWGAVSEKQIFDDLQRKLAQHFSLNASPETQEELVNLLQSFHDRYYE